MNNNNYYLPNPTSYHLRQLGFHYSPQNECYVYIFPIFYHKGRPTLLCRVLYNHNKLDNKIICDILKPNNERLALYYDNEYGKADGYIKRIDSIVNKKMKSMGFKKKKKHVNKTKKEKKD